MSGTERASAIAADPSVLTDAEASQMALGLSADLASELFQPARAIRLGAAGWERRDERTDAWVALREPYNRAPIEDALQYLAGFYGVHQRHIEIDLRAPEPGGDA